ncbi:MAG TPA: hypothetical protein VK153_00715 [Candidatus Paceibacterota bacterium]|nr:hypothetical protein [Candidatus Paceibacterota bacterium]
MRDIPTSPRALEIKRNRRVRKMRWFVVYLLLIGSLIWGLSLLSKDRHIVISNIIVNGTHVINQDDVKNEINKILSGKYVYLFPKANSFIYPHKKIYNNLLLSFPRIESLKVDRGNLQTINVDIKERTGSFLYCGVNIPENKNDIGENCYFVNNDGFIFDKAPYFSGNVYFKYYMALPDGVVNPLGNQMTTEEEFHKIARFVDGVESLGFKPIYLFRDVDKTDYLYLDNGTNSTGPKVMFKNDDDLEEVFDNLSIAMAKKEFADEINSKYNTLLYIDLRFPNKVLYKFQ